MEDHDDNPPDSLLPYDEWTEEALRHVLVRALRHVSVHGLPGQHHFYITFRTDHPGTDIPARLRAKFPEEMTIVLQHQFWDLSVDEHAGIFSVGLSFGGIGSMLVVPLSAVTAFADPYVRYGLQFHVHANEPAEIEEPPPAPVPEEEPDTDSVPQVVSLDAFRRRQPGKDT
jgi:hypothetical protein